MSRTVSPPPLFWQQLLQWHLHASPQLARQLWAVYSEACDTTTLWHLMLCSSEPTIERVMRTAARIRPQDLMAASEALVLPGKLRRQDIVMFQNRLLECLGPQGQWR